MNKISLITTVKNEEKSINVFLESIAEQTLKPDEIIIVDGGSTDQTIKLLEDTKLNIRVIKKKGNRSVGRNEGIKNTKNSIIAVTDAGCILNKHWFERITKPFEDKTVDVVAGFYKPVTNTVFEKCLSTYTCTMEDKLNKDTFLPSSRSVAFRKSAWEKVHGYPEHLDLCEDLVFDKKLKKEGMRFVTQEKAIVYWPQRKNIFQAFKQFYWYAKGDGQARYVRITTPFLFARYLLGFFLLAYALVADNLVLIAVCCTFFVFYLLWSIAKNYKYVKDAKAVLYLPLLQIVSDIAVLFGMSVGHVRSLR